MNRRLPQIAIAACLLGVLPAVAPAAPRVDEGLVRDAIERSWPELQVAGQTLEVEFAPALLGEAGGTVHVDWPKPPLAPGPRAITVTYEVNGRVVSRALANILVRQEVTVWILNGDVKRGQTITADDLHESTKVWDRDPKRAITGEIPGGGYVARQNLTAGSWLRHSDVRPRPDVQAGEEIYLVARAGHAAVSVPTNVRRGGSVGDTILVLNPLTGTVVRALLVSRHHAELTVADATGERRSL